MRKKGVEKLLMTFDTFFPSVFYCFVSIGDDGEWTTKTFPHHWNSGSWNSVIIIIVLGYWVGWSCFPSFFLRLILNFPNLSTRLGFEWLWKSTVSISFPMCIQRFEAKLRQIYLPRDCFLSFIFPWGALLTSFSISDSNSIEWKRATMWSRKKSREKRARN